MAVVMPPGKQAYTRSDGTPLVGGRLRTFAAGTSTPKPTYADAAGTIANTNPVVLDARGEARCELVLDASVVQQGLHATVRDRHAVRLVEQS